MSSGPKLGGNPGANNASLVPGGVIGDGRYRLLAYSGTDDRCAAQLWRGRDGQLNRDVALTVLVGDLPDLQAAGRARRTVERAMHASSFTHPGVARVIDVLTPGTGIKPGEGILGIIVADWTPGTDLVDLLAEGPLPAGTATRLLAPLGAAIEGAHHAGLVLGADHPQRIRVTPDGKLRLAFPGPRPEAVARDDVRGLGAVLYLLLTGRWALPGGPSAVPAAPTGPDGTVIAPNVLQPRVPHELSSVAVRSLEDTSVGGIRTSAAILQVLEQIAGEESQSGVLEDTADGSDDDRAVWTTQRPQRGREHKRKLVLSVAVLAAATLAVIAWLGVQIVSFFSDEGPSGGGPTVVIEQSGSQGVDGDAAPTRAEPAGPVQPASVGVYDVTNQPDNANRGSRAADSDAGTAWQTDDYLQPFPSLKPGIGLMASFAEPVKLASVTITSPSAGTKVEIRTAPSESAPLEETTVLTSADLSAGQTQIQLGDHEPAQHVLVWITTLAKAGQGNQTEIAELVYTRAG
ncbi:protein kinase family protein [Umezawaea beigongshangensis]|uniref:protein kinase family protein n=1 Tax=Umezawaea beigongshangensis TaxID=2780383 RepID=UPI0027DB7608|nr:protein kinase family protein [Umezawaea beigongshangensis]